MKIIIFIICSLPISTYCQSSDTFYLKNNLPLRKPFILVNKSFLNDTDWHSRPGLDIFSGAMAVDSVFAVTNGEVVKIAEIGIDTICIVKSGRKHITYANLRSCILKKRRQNKKG